MQGMVGGTVIEALAMKTRGGRDVVRLWCVDKMDECAVYADPESPDGLPSVGDRIWWQSGQIMFDGDKRTARKIGFSFDPRQAND
jgi:hypothetical protein